MGENWTWSYADAAGRPVADAGVTSAFPSQADAEAYLGEVWQELADLGVSAVTLWREGELVYGPMPLAAKH